MRNLVLPLACAVLLASTAAASDLRSPFKVVARNPALGTLDVEVDTNSIIDLAARGDTVLRGVALPGGAALDLELTRVDLARCKFEFFVDNVAAPGLLDALDLSVWMGHVVGSSDSEVALSFSHTGCMGWVRRDGEQFHLVPDAGRFVWVDDASYGAAGVGIGSYCDADSLPVPPSVSPSTSGPTQRALSGPQFLTTQLYECKVAVETDYQLFQRWNNLATQTSYVTSLLAWASYRYEEQIRTVLTYPYVMFYTTAADPWVAQENGGTAGTLLSEFRAAWQNNVPSGGHLGCFLSGASLGGGVAWLPGLCNGTYNFSVCGNINGQTIFPIAVRPTNWDFMVLAHEVGHNFGSKHTHSYCPPLDQCAPSGYFGSCQTAQVCTNQGTIMSYCHLCSGGTSNITTYFHPTCVTDMRTRVETTCLPVYCADPVVYCNGKVNSLGCTPAISYTGHPTLSGLDDFHVVCSQTLNLQNGILFWGTAIASTSFQGGMRCVALPLVRTALQVAGSGAPGNNCTGTYDFFFSHAYTASESVGVGDTLYAQYWSRDPLSPSSTGLSNALHFTWCN